MPTAYFTHDPSIQAYCDPLDPVEQEVTTAYFAKQISKKQYKTKVTDHKTTKGQTLAIIAKKYGVKTKAVKRTKKTKYLQIGEIVKVTIKEVTGKKITFKKIKNALLNDEVYIVVETKHLEKENVLINIYQGEEDVFAKVNELIMVQQDGKDVKGLIRTKVGGYTEKDMLNTKDYEDWAIAKIKLQPVGDTKQKEWKDNLECTSQNKAKLYLRVDVHTENSIPRFKADYVEYKGYVGNSDSDTTKNHFLNEEGNWFEVINAITEYEIYSSNKIDKKTAKDAKKGKYVYIDANKKRHDLGTYDFVKVKNNYGSTYGGKNVNLIDFRKVNNYQNGDVKFGISLSTTRYYMNEDTLASLFGAMIKCGYEDFTCTGFSKKDGSPGVSKSHKNGYNGDFRYLRKDKTGGRIRLDYNKRKDNVESWKELDKDREETFIKELNNYGWKSMLSQKYGKKKDKKLKKIKVDKDGHHYDHLHIQSYNHKFIKEKTE